MVVFRLKMHFSGSKSATKFLCVITVSDRVVRIHCLSIVQKWLAGYVPSENLAETDPSLQINICPQPLSRNI